MNDNVISCKSSQILTLIFTIIFDVILTLIFTIIFDVILLFSNVVTGVDNDCKMTCNDHSTEEMDEQRFASGSEHRATPGQCRFPLVMTFFDVNILHYY